MRRLLLLTVLAVLSVSYMAIALRNIPEYYPGLPYPHEFSDDNSKNEDPSEYYKPTIRENYEVHKPKSDLTLNYDNENYHVRASAVESQVTRRPRIEQYLKEVAPTTKTMYSQPQVYRNGNKKQNAAIPQVSSSYKYQMFERNPKSVAFSQSVPGYQVEEPTTPQSHTVPYLRRPKVQRNKLQESAQLPRSFPRPDQNIETSAQTLRPAFSNENTKYYLQLSYDDLEEPTAQKHVEDRTARIQAKAKTSSKYLPNEEDQGPSDGLQYETGNNRAELHAQQQPIHRFNMAAPFRYQNIPVFDHNIPLKAYYPQPTFQDSQKPFHEPETEDNYPPTTKPYQVRPTQQIMKRISYSKPVQTVDSQKPFQEQETEENYPISLSYQRPIVQPSKLVHYHKKISPAGLSRNPEDRRKPFQVLEQEENYPTTRRAYHTVQSAYETTHYPVQIENTQKKFQDETEENYPRQFAPLRKGHKIRARQRSDSLIRTDKSGYYQNESPRSSTRIKVNFLDDRKPQRELVRQALTDIKAPTPAQELSMQSQLAYTPYQPEMEVALESPLDSQGKRLGSFNTHPIYSQSYQLQRNKVATPRSEISQGDTQQEPAKLEHQLRYYDDYGENAELHGRFQEQIDRRYH